MCPIHSLCSTNSTMSALGLKLSLLYDLLTSSFSDTITLPMFQNSAPDHSNFYFVILYNTQPMQNLLTHYYTAPTCFAAIVSP